MRILEIVNPDGRLFFGKNPSRDETLDEITGRKNRPQAVLIANSIRRAREERRNICFEYISVGDDGDPVRVYAHVECFANGSACLSLIEQGDGEYSAAWEPYAEADDLNAAVLNALSAGVLVCASNGTLLYANDAASRIFGMDARKVLRASLNLNDDPGLPQKVKNALRQNAPVSACCSYNFDVVNKSGYYESSHNRMRRIRCNGRPVFDGSGRTVNYVFTVEDASENPAH